MCEMPTRKIYDKISVYSNDESLDATFGLLMNILKRPTLGRYVHHIEVCSATSWHMAFKETEPRRGLSEEDTALVREAVRKTGFSGSDENRIMNILMQKLVYARSPIFQ